MSRILFSSVVAAGSLTFALTGFAAAQGIGSNCVPTESQPCFTLTPLDVNRGNTIVPPADAELLDPAALGQTFACNVVTGDAAAGVTTGPLIRDCGPPADLANLKPYYGTKAASAPVVEAPVAVAAPTPGPTVVQVPIAAGPAPAVFGSVLPAGGLGGSSIGMLAMGAAAVGIAAAVAGGLSSSGTTTGN